MSARQYTKGKQKPVVNHPALIAGCVPPHDLDAEAAVLSAILLSRDALDRVLEILKAEHFYSDANGRVYEAMVTLAIAGTPIDIVSVASWLRDRERLAQIGGPTYLAQLADATPAVAHVDAHAKVVFEKWRIRSLIAVCQRVSAEGYGDYGESQKFIDGAEQDIYAIARTAKTSKVQLIRDVMAAAFTQIQQTAERGDKLSGIASGFDKFDEKTAGLHVGDLMIVAARPGMGKSAWALNVAVNVAAPHDVAGYEHPMSTHGVAVFSLEMPREQCAVRMVCSEARVDLGKVRQGMLQPDDWRRLTEAAAFLSDIPLWIDDSPSLNILELRAKVRRIQAEFNREATATTPERKLGAVVVDYLQLMSGTGREDSREQEIAGVSRGLKQLAKELGVPVIALAQLNRSVETRTTKSKIPQLSDLRESGSLEQDADTIVFIYRDEYYFPESEKKGIAELIIAKQRNGPTGKVMTRFTNSCTRFDNLALEDYPQDADE